MDKVGNHQEERKLHALLTADKTKERARHIFRLLTPQKGSGFSRITVKANATEEEYLKYIREVCNKAELEKISMKEICQCSIMS